MSECNPAIYCYKTNFLLSVRGIYTPQTYTLFIFFLSGVNIIWKNENQPQNYYKIINSQYDRQNIMALPGQLQKYYTTIMPIDALSLKTIKNNCLWKYYENPMCERSFTLKANVMPYRVERLNENKTQVCPWYFVFISKIMLPTGNWYPDIIRTNAS